MSSPDLAEPVLLSLLGGGFVAAFLHAALPTHWLPFVLVGRAQRYVHDVKADIQREVNLGELKQLHSEVHDAAQSLRAAPIEAGVENTRGLAMVLYDRYALMFQLAGLILLVSMIGAILLTMRHRRDIKRQNVLKQMWTDPKKQLELRDVKPGQGL